MLHMVLVVMEVRVVVMVVILLIVEPASIQHILLGSDFRPRHK